jgi:hypothetical protein
MKNTVRAQRKVGTKAPSSQVKTTHDKKPVGSTVRIVLKDDTSVPIAAVEISQAAYDAMWRDVKAEGIDIATWIKNAVEAEIANAQTAASDEIKYPAVKSPFDPKFDLAAGQKENSCLCFFDRENQEPTSKVPLTDEEMDALFRAQLPARPGSPSKSDIVAEAVRARLAKPETDAAGRRAVNELHEAVQQSHALSMLLYEFSNRDCESKCSDYTQCGILELIYATDNRLTGAHDTFNAMFYPSSSVATKGVAS